MSLFSDKLFTQNPGSGSGGDGASWGNITGTLSDQTDLQTALSDKQDNLESGTNIKTVNGASLLGEGNLAVKTYQSFGSSWHTNTSFTEFLDDVRDDSTAVQGMAYLGELRCSGLPSGLINVEAVVEIMTGSTASSKVIHVVITSGNLDPYRWEYTYWNSGQDTSGWVAFQPKLTAGDHIKIENNVISQDGADLSNVSSEGSVQLVEEKNGFGINSDTWAYLKLDGNLNNSNPYTPNLTVETEQGSPEFTSATGGVFNNGLTLGGAYLLMSDEVKKTTAGTITIDFWLLTPSLTGQKTILINYGELGVASNQVAIIFYPTNNGLVLYLYDFDTRSGDYNYVDGVIDTGYWTHYCLTIGNYKNASHTYSLGFSTPDLDITVEDYLAFTAPKTACPGGLNDFSFYATFADATIDEIHIQNKIFSNWYLMDSQYTLEQPTGNYTIDSSEVATQSDLANYVTTNTVQSITARKNFSQLIATALQVNGTASFVNQTYQNYPLMLNKRSAYLLDGVLVQDTHSYLNSGTPVTKAIQVTSFDTDNNTATYSIKAGPDASHQAGVEITGDANGKANLTLTNPDISADDSSNKVPTTEWVKENTYNSTNLTSGSSISIAQQSSGGGIDSDTWAYLKLDDNLDNSASSGTTASYSNPTFSTGKFNNGLNLVSDTNLTLTNTNTPITSNSLTIDFWWKIPNVPSDTESLLICWSGRPQIRFVYDTTGFHSYLGASSIEVTLPIQALNLGEWTHCCATITGINETNQTVTYGFQTPSISYLNTNAGSGTTSLGLLNQSSIYLTSYSSNSTGELIDELHIQSGTFTNWTNVDSQYTVPIYKTAINFDPTSITGYASSGTKVLKLVDGVLTWVAE